MKRLGLIVNPVAGVGGRVGLKGSDGADIVHRALELGAVRESPHRAQLALRRLVSLREHIEVFTWPAEMGADEARACGFDATVAGQLPRHAETTAADTEEAARALRDAGVDLLLFAGGDGTARDIFNAVGDSVPALGIPAGVKLHSAVYANTPAAAGDLAALYLQGRREAMRLREAEVMDIDEEAFRLGHVSTRLYGYLRVPYQRTLLQSAKAGGVAGDAGEQQQVHPGVAQRTRRLLGVGGGRLRHMSRQLARHCSVEAASTRLVGTHLGRPGEDLDVLPQGDEAAQSKLGSVRGHPHRAQLQRPVHDVGAVAALEAHAAADTGDRVDDQPEPLHPRINALDNPRRGSARGVVAGAA